MLVHVFVMNIEERIIILLGVNVTCSTWDYETKINVLKNVFNSTRLKLFIDFIKTKYFCLT